MKYKDRQSEFVLTTGRKIYGNGPFRLSPSADGKVDYGSDGTEGNGIEETEWMMNSHLVKMGDKMSPYSKEERTEIADYMIAAWMEWAKSGTAEPAENLT